MFFCGEGGCSRGWWWPCWWPCWWMDGWADGYRVETDVALQYEIDTDIIDYTVPETHQANLLSFLSRKCGKN